ncbi:MAG: dihydrodipicolinate synthase family protein [Bacteroidales bacterium]|nr:dihydrodipicolinate synthase family protein [Bacteroidales bacterium]
MKTLEEKLGRIIIPLVTPFDKDSDTVNYKTAENLADYIIEKEHCDSIAVTGTTGEFITMTVGERIDMFKVVKETAAGRVPLVAGVGAASVKEAVMIVAPFYCRPIQEGIYKFFKTVAKSVSIDIMLYNIPLFTGVNVEPETVSRLVNELENVKS